MQKFEYKEFKIRRDRDSADSLLIDKLNEFGKDGWDAFHILDEGDIIRIHAKRVIPFQSLSFNLPLESGTNFFTPEGSPILPIMGLGVRQDLKP